MARDGITFEQVTAAADALVGCGQQPTIRGIREALGTGSPNTVHKHLAAWREARPQAVASASVLPKTEDKLNFVFPQPGEHDGSCPKCEQGQLKRKIGANGPFWYCSRWNADPKCDASYKDDDGKPLVVAPIFCPKCKTGRLHLIPGKEKPFWSCSNYRNETAQCKAAFPDRGGAPDLTTPAKSFKSGITKF
jgi:ssDNA-binding Zn-finger/Zn-ribbon topoisomerase 1